MNPHEFARSLGIRPQNPIASRPAREDEIAAITLNAARLGFPITIPPGATIGEAREIFRAATAGAKPSVPVPPAIERRPSVRRAPWVENPQPKPPPGHPRAESVRRAMAAGLNRKDAEARWGEFLPPEWVEYLERENRKAENREAGLQTPRPIRPAPKEERIDYRDLTIPGYLRQKGGRKPTRFASDNPDPHRLARAGNRGESTGQKCQVNAAVALLVDEALENL